ncbi:hypothetical protein AA0482_1669 [Acetobacter cibinongensis NRIC 0482]|nr:hypothetical protein AA0482_1669 [Acetobacter cibinongensis NRIC 0482]
MAKPIIYAVSATDVATVSTCKLLAMDGRAVERMVPSSCSINSMEATIRAVR